VEGAAGGEGADRAGGGVDGRADCTTGSGLEAQEREVWLDTWKKLRLQRLHGFPVWDEQLYHTLRPQFATVCRLRERYSTELPKTWEWLVAPELASLQPTEETSRADWLRLVSHLALGGTADTAVNGAAFFDSHSQEGAKGLTLAEFVSALIELAFALENPHYESDRSAGELTGRQRLVQVPECVETFVFGRLALANKQIDADWTRAELALAKSFVEEKNKAAQHASSEVRVIVGKVKRMQQLEKGRGKGGGGGLLEVEMNAAQAALDLAQEEADELARVQQKKQKDIATLQREIAQLKEALQQAKTKGSTGFEEAPTSPSQEAAATVPKRGAAPVSAPQRRAPAVSQGK